MVAFLGGVVQFLGVGALEEKLESVWSEDF